MKQPAWDDPNNEAGGMVRGALWLVQVVGEGQTFTKNQLREAFPGMSQVDRRIRDLRDYGWVLHSSSQDASLLAEDQRFVRAGVPVWDSKARRDAAPNKAISAKERRAALVRSNYMCTLCGIAGGEPYPDDPSKDATVSVSRRTVLTLDGGETRKLVTECTRCLAGRDETPIDLKEAVIAGKALDTGDKRRLLRWMERGRRGTTELDRAWAAYLRIPAEQRKDVSDSLRADE